MFQEIWKELRAQSAKRLVQLIFLIIAGLMVVVGSAALRYFTEIGAVIPPGAVVAFNLGETKPCPDGWSLLDEAKGRFLIGAGNHASKDAEGHLLPQLPSLRTSEGAAIGGRVALELSLSQLPQHTHSRGPNTVIVVEPNNPNKDFNLAFAKLGGRMETNSGPIENWPGSQEPINIMPPYVALFYCIKK